MTYSRKCPNLWNLFTIVSWIRLDGWRRSRRDLLFRHCLEADPGENSERSPESKNFVRHPETAFVACGSRASTRDVWTSEIDSQFSPKLAAESGEYHTERWEPHQLRHWDWISHLFNNNEQFRRLTTSATEPAIRGPIAMTGSGSLPFYNTSRSSSAKSGNPRPPISNAWSGKSPITSLPISNTLSWESPRISVANHRYATTQASDTSPVSLSKRWCSPDFELLTLKMGTSDVSPKFRPKSSQSSEELHVIALRPDYSSSIVSSTPSSCCTDQSRKVSGAGLPPEHFETLRMPGRLNNCE
jgi:hypothetical protein